MAHDVIRNTAGRSPGARRAPRRARRRDRPAIRALVVLSWVALTLAACGKKGPPLAPIVRVPAAVEKLAAQRVGHDVYLTVTIPTQNIDGSTPADVDRIVIYAVTASTAPPRARMFELTSPVATIAVQPPPDPAAAAPEAASATLPAQGAAVTVRETLTPAALVPTTVSEPVPSRTSAPPAPAASASAAGSSAAAASSIARRYYFAVAVSDRERPGPPSTMIDLPLLPLPETPGPLTFTYTQDAVTIAWQPAGGVLGFLLDRTLPPEDPPVYPPAGPAAPAGGGIAPPSGPTMYNVYRELPGDGGSGRPGAGQYSVMPPAPLNAAPIGGFSFTDQQQIELDQERCYVVRAVRGTPPNLVIGAPSARQCMVTVDRFAPEPPTGLSAIAGDGLISLLWEPNGEADLGGYIVLRGQAGDATLQRLTSAPLMETRYTDRDVQPGVRYVYAVQAVDMHQPAANISAESSHVEETAR